MPVPVTPLIAIYTSKLADTVIKKIKVIDEMYLKWDNGRIINLLFTILNPKKG